MKFISLLPTEANNNYQGLKFALWFFYLYLALVAFRSFTHMFAQDAGLNSIASIIVFPEVNNLNPNSVIYLIGSLWGCLLYTSPSPRDRTRSRMPSSA